MSVVREREALRAEISAYCKKLVLSQRAVQLCESEATPKQEEFLHRVLTEELENRERSRRASFVNPCLRRSSRKSCAEVPVLLRLRRAFDSDPITSSGASS